MTWTLRVTLQHEDHCDPILERRDIEPEDMDTVIEELFGDNITIREDVTIKLSRD